MTRRAAVLLLAAALLVAVCSAARFPSDVEQMLEKDLAAGFQDISALLGHSRHSQLNRRRKHDPVAYVVFKYYVPPSKADDFIDEWKKLEDGTRGEKHNRWYDLKKTMDDNVVFYGYGEWEDEDSFKDHLMQGYTRDFFDFLLDQDIPLRWQPLFKLTGDVQKEKSSNRKEKDQAHIIIRYTVPPHQAEDFIEVWKDTADRVDKDEDGARIYSLRKVATNNLEWYVYGTWASFDDYMDHFKSDHCKKLRDWNADHDVIWNLSPMYKLGKEREPRE